MTPPLAPELREALQKAVGASTLNAAFEGIVTFDEDQRVVMINEAAQRMFRCDHADALGRPLSRFIPARLHDVHATHVRAFEASGATGLRMAERSALVGLRADGEEFPLEASVARVDIPGPAGARRYFTALLHDLSEVQRLKSEIDMLNSRMRDIFELAPVAIWITGYDRVIFANRACAELFGAADPAHLIGRSVYSLLQPESHARVRRMMAQALDKATPVPRVSEHIARLDGGVREVEIAAAELPNHGPTILQMVITDLTERRREGRSIERSRRELRQLSASLVNAREEERRRIARELHDELGQQLTALKMELTGLGAPPALGVPPERIVALCEMVDETVAAVRRIAADLRPLMLDDLGLIAAIEWLGRESARRFGIDIALHLGEADPPISEAASIALYRMVQEALTNIARHAHATRASIELQHQDDDLILTVQDDGVGLSETAVTTEGSHGLMGIRERAYMLGGTLEIGDACGGGGRITIRLPLSRLDGAERESGQVRAARPGDAR